MKRAVALTQFQRLISQVERRGGVRPHNRVYHMLKRRSKE